MKTKKVGKPSGFTLIELLVVIAIIGVLVGLLLASRSAGSRSCKTRFLQQQFQANGLGTAYL